MLRDNLPEPVDLALKWCKTKGKWIDYVYDKYIWFLADKEQRKYQTKAILGLVNANREFKFHDTIEWSDLSDEDEKHWKNVETWGDWFNKYHSEIKEDIFLNNQVDLEQYVPDLDDYWKKQLHSYLIKSYH